MTLASPVALALLAIAVPIVLAFLARQRARRQVVGSVMLLRRAAGVAASRALVPRLRHPFALVLTLLTLVALVLGVASPRCGEAPRGRWIVVLDAPPEVGWTRPDGRTAWNEALDRLATLLRAPGAAEVLAIHAAPVPRVVAGVSADGASVLTWASAIRPGADSDPLDVRAFADLLCEDPERDGVIWVGAPPPVAQRCPITALTAEARPPLTELVGIKATRTERLGELEVLVAVADSTGAPGEVVVELRVDDQLVDVVPARTNPGGLSWTRRALPVDGEVVVATLPGGHPAGKNRVVAVGPPAAPTRVTWASARPPDDSSFLKAALELHPRVRLTFQTTTEGAEAADLLIVEGDLPVPTGPRVTWAIGPEAAANAGVVVLDALEDPTITRWAFQDSLLRLVDLDGVRLATARALAPPAGGRVLVEADGYPVLVRSSRGSGTLLAGGFSPADSDLPLRVDFLHWIANIVDEAAPGDGDLPPAVVGRPWSGGVAGEVLRGPAGEFDARAPLPGPGVYEIIGSDGTVRGRLTPAELPAAPRDSSPALPAPTAGIQGQPWWFWAAVAAAVLLAVETVLGAVFRGRAA